MSDISIFMLEINQIEHEKDQSFFDKLNWIDKINWDETHPMVTLLSNIITDMKKNWIYQILS